MKNEHGMVSLSLCVSARAPEKLVHKIIMAFFFWFASKRFFFYRRRCWIELNQFRCEHAKNKCQVQIMSTIHARNIFTHIHLLRTAIRPLAIRSSDRILNESNAKQTENKKDSKKQTSCLLQKVLNVCKIVMKRKMAANSNMVFLRHIRPIGFGMGLRRAKRERKKKRLSALWVSLFRLMVFFLNSKSFLFCKKRNAFHPIPCKLKILFIGMLFQGK